MQYKVVLANVQILSITNTTATPYLKKKTLAMLNLPLYQKLDSLPPPQASPLSVSTVS